MGIFYGTRTRWDEKTEKVESEKKPGKMVERKFMQKSEDNGLLCFLKQKGNVLIHNLLNPETKELVSEQSALNITPVSMDQTIYCEKQKENAEEENNYFTPSLLSLMGARDGTIYVYDPLIVTTRRIHSFNHDETMPFYKKKSPVIVKWVEPLGNQNPTKFAVVFEDATIYIYEKDVTHDPKEDYTKAIIQTDTNNGDKDLKNFHTKSDIVLKM